jgi:glycine/D-amino acid oxidase-like deaminating enzyme
MRPVPLDGLPVVGSVPGVQGAFAAVMHSGVTLGPLVGQLLASEILKGVQSSLLTPFRPARFS